MKIVLDSNVLVTALLSPYGSPAQVLQMLLSEQAQLCYDARILSEHRAVLARPKFGFDPEPIAALLDYLEKMGILAATSPLPVTLPDPDDEMFLEAALAAHADHLVTGNLRHFPAHRRCGVSVVSPAELIRLSRADSPPGVE